jgi:hypothetical protein
MSTDLRLAFEKAPGSGPKDETDYALRYYIAGLSPEHLAEYNPAWSDEQVKEWDGNFRSDDALMLVCCERDVDVGEFRETLEEFLRFREQS